MTLLLGAKTGIDRESETSRGGWPILPSRELARKLARRRSVKPS